MSTNGNNLTATLIILRVTIFYMFDSTQFLRAYFLRIQVCGILLLNKISSFYIYIRLNIIESKNKIESRRKNVEAEMKLCC